MLICQNSGIKIVQSRVRSIIVAVDLCLIKVVLLKLGQVGGWKIQELFSVCDPTNIFCHICSPPHLMEISYFLTYFESNLGQFINHFLWHLKTSRHSLEYSKISSISLHRLWSIFVSFVNLLRILLSFLSTKFLTFVNSCLNLPQKTYLIYLLPF